MSQLDDAFSGTKAVADALKFDQRALETWMDQHVGALPDRSPWSSSRAGNRTRPTS